IMNNWALSVLGSGEAPRPMGVGNPALAPYQTIATADGDYMLGCGNDGHWRRFCEAMGYQDLLADERFTTNDDRVAHRAPLIAAIEDSHPRPARRDAQGGRGARVAGQRSPAGAG